MPQLDREHIERLSKSRQIIGELSPVIIDSDGEILAGVYRKEAGWLRTYNVDTEALAKKWDVPRQVAKEMVRVNSNIQRKVKAEETKASLLKMAKAFETQGIPKEKIATEVANRVPFTHQYVLQLLPDEYKHVEKAVSPGRPPSETVKPEVKVIKAPETWEYRKAVMEAPVSRMDEAVMIELERLGIPFEAQKEFCVQSTICDVYLPSKRTAIYLDGPVHERREERDEALRALLSKRYGVRVVSIPYESFSRSTLQMVVERIREEST